MRNKKKIHNIQKDFTDQSVRIVHSLSLFCHCQGKLIIASYGQNPKTGEDIPPKVGHFFPGDVDGTNNFINQNQEPHRNFYMPLCLMRPDLPPGKKGGFDDVVLVFGLCCDFDDDDARQYLERLPLPPSYVMETSEGRYQAQYIFDRPIEKDVAKTIAKHLKEYSQCDHGTKDICHVWRIAGTLNYPNKKKVNTDGRSPDPQLVRVELPYSGVPIPVDSLIDNLDLWANQERQLDSNIPSQNNDVRGEDLFQWDGNINSLPLAPGTINLITAGVDTGYRSEAMMTVLNGLVWSNLNDSQIYDIFNFYQIGEKYLQHKNPEKWLQPQINKARSRITIFAKQIKKITTNNSCLQDLKKDEGSHWAFEDAEFYLLFLSEQNLSSQQKIKVIEDVFENQNFSPIEIDILKDLVKTHFKIKKETINTLLKNERNIDNNQNNLTHIQISDVYLMKIQKETQKVVGCENSFWGYSDQTDGLFSKFPLTDVEIAIGRDNVDEKNCKRGSDYKAVARLVYNSIKDNAFFNSAPYGLPGNTIFYLINNDDYSIEPRSYSWDLRQRWKLSVDPDNFFNPKNAPLFTQFLDFAFKDDDQQKMMLQEIIGALCTGIMKYLQKAVLLYGKGENGKSVILDLLTHMFPKELRCAIKPDKMDEDYFKACLSGKVINIIGELEKSKAIKADFKDIVACDTPLTARLPYQEPFEFLPQVGHIFSTNAFPMTKDHSHGFYRRWAIIEFKNKISAKKKIPRLGEKIARNEMGAVLAWALEGAKRLIKNNFALTKTEQHHLLMCKWQNKGDSVFSFLNDDDAVVYADGACVSKQGLYTVYKSWARDEAGVHPVGRNKFYERVKLKLDERQLHTGVRVFEGIGFRNHIQGCQLYHYNHKVNGYNDEYYSIERVPF